MDEERSTPEAAPEEQTMKERIHRAREATVEAIQGTDDMLTRTRRLVSTTLRSASDLWADMGRVAVSTVEGAIDAVRNVGTDAARDLGEETARTVREAQL